MINLKRLKILTFFLKHPIIRTYKTVHIYQIPIIIIEKLEKYEIQKGREKIMEITGKTILTGLIGSPVAHSISPQMHNEAFRQLGLDYVYLAFDLAGSDLGTAVRGLRDIGAKGFNVTMPYKVHVLEYMDELTPAAKIAQACNTVIIKDGRLTGHTTAPFT